MQIIYASAYACSVFSSPNDLELNKGPRCTRRKKSEMDVHVRMTKWTHHALCMYTSERKGVPLAVNAQLSLF